ncbi:hypothetical protein ACFRI7_30050 [Streptomyces sp. NPDC056716]|uniref:hypothetical protein n=1 Tax=unclassified Streptomyces TaxID=2593676 RepID=UPI0036956F33
MLALLRKMALAVLIAVALVILVALIDPVYALVLAVLLFIIGTWVFHFALSHREPEPPADTWRREGNRGPGQLS